ncbi:unnamed protein product [Haemonchus placei]|uniref:Protein S-acyltransferase n=1 Tax=Haemonchus placei TaxID=6290 RepID=A0A0N4WD70_HAEPC|nr:unnamed protein product [Haemonchus placei]
MRMLLESLKWWASVIGWLAALASWFQIIIVLGLGREEILDHQWKFFVFIFLWIIITCSYFNAVIAVSVGSLLKTQLQSLLSNRTTIEDSQLSFLDEDEMNHEFSIFDLGSRMANFCSVFGKFPLTWLLPVYTTPGDGVNYNYVVRCGREFAAPTPPPRKKRFWKLC